eukprot:1144735-Pelagomonas_calceolata.AAC.3
MIAVFLTAQGMPKRSFFTFDLLSSFLDIQDVCIVYGGYWNRFLEITKEELQGSKQIDWLHSKILDKSSFNGCIKSLSNNKSPGPDGIVNKILRMLPHEFQESIHKLYIIMWATHLTPVSWKTSDTILTDKNREETEISSYRPIWLANTLYKLWARIVTNTLYEYAEAHSLLSSSQAGFRNQKDTIQQLQDVIMGLEDAKAFGKDIYALIVLQYYKSSRFHFCF